MQHFVVPLHHHHHHLARLWTLAVQPRLQQKPKQYQQFLEEITLMRRVSVLHARERAVLLLLCEPSLVQHLAPSQCRHVSERVHTPAEFMLGSGVLRARQPA
jgi:hypothetical protein